MGKKEYIKPYSEVIRTILETQLLTETGVDTGGGKIPIVPVSDLDDDEEISAKPHNLWDEDDEDIW